MKPSRFSNSSEVIVDDPRGPDVVFWAAGARTLYCDDD